MREKRKAKDTPSWQTKKEKKDEVKVKSEIRKTWMTKNRRKAEKEKKEVDKEMDEAEAEVDMEERATVVRSQAMNSFRR
jgi:nucleolar complex protein 3